MLDLILVIKSIAVPINVAVRTVFQQCLTPKTEKNILSYPYQKLRNTSMSQGNILGKNPSTRQPETSNFPFLL